MLDYIKLFIKDPNAMKSDFPKLNLREEKENFLEKIYRTGKLKNLDIKITYEGIWIRNSLCKFIHGNNLHDMQPLTYFQNTLTVIFHLQMYMLLNLVNLFK